jgi:hypothetical protein
MHFRATIAAIALTVSLAICGARAIGDELPYRLVTDSEIQVKSPAQPKGSQMTSRMVLRYDLGRTGDLEEVTIRGMEVKVSLEGRTMMNSRMDRGGARFQEGGPSATDVPYDRAPDPLKKMLSQFDVPAARFSLDAEGGEIGREILLQGDSSLVENGVVDNARLFHVRFPSGKTEWESPGKLSMGTGHFAQGTLKYVKEAADEQGLVRVSVSGELKADGKIAEGEVRNGVYRVSGHQVYDPSRSCWTSGQLEVNVTLDMVAAGQDAGSATGLIKIRLVQEADDSEAPAPNAAPPAPAGRDSTSNLPG